MRGYLRRRGHPERPVEGTSGWPRVVERRRNGTCPFGQGSVRPRGRG
ncbi:hypothetical protein TOK_2432 [Pseudonocardia sp. N23]|nr:hypothetical protein TOK_2432 [Pseudonocardia sp. N23]